MFAPLQAALTQWSLAAAALACFAAAFAAFLYVPVVGHWLALVLVALGVALGFYDLGYQARGKLDKSGAIQAQLDEANRELSATKQIATAAADAAQAAEAFNASQQEKIRAYQAKLEKGPKKRGCALSDDDVRSLSDIGAAAAPDAAGPAAGVRKANSGAKGLGGR